MREVLREEFGEMIEELASEPRVLCHRDYHSRNLMYHQERLYIIDFQDARMGPDTYDLASLLRDAYVDLPEQTVNDLLTYFLALKGATGLGTGVSRPVRSDGAAAEPEGPGDVRLSDDRATQPRIHPIHPRTPGYVRDNLEAQPRFARLRDVLAGHVEEFR